LVRLLQERMMGGWMIPVPLRGLLKAKMRRGKGACSLANLKDPRVQELIVEKDMLVDTFLTV
jgi:hypothetical protein